MTQSRKKIAVITPYNNEDSRLIKKANVSIWNQNCDDFICEHIIIVDGQDLNKSLQNINCIKLELGKNYNNNGNTPRSIGTNIAISMNYDFIMYLDTDNWFMDQHVESLLSLSKNGEQIACSYRTFFNMKDEKLNYLEDSDCLKKTHVDTSCFLIPRLYYRYINIWHLIPNEISQWCDRIFFSNLLFNKCNIAYTEKHTVAFRSTYDVHYLRSGAAFPNNVKICSEINKKPHEFFVDKKNQDLFKNIFGFAWT
jgi:hypothetical protein